MSGQFSGENIGHGQPGHAPRPSEPAQPSSFTFDEESEAQIAKVLARYPEGRQASGVIPLLWIVQKQMWRQTNSGWVPRVAMDVIAARLGMPPIRVYEVATFYLMFNTKPVGKYHLQVCTTTPCWLRGSDQIVSACRNATGLRHWGETTEDGLFTMTEVECLGACANAPIVQVNDDYYEDLDAERTKELIEALRRGKTPPYGPTIDRFNSAPVGGRTTLLEQPVPPSQLAGQPADKPKAETA